MESSDSLLLTMSTTSQSSFSLSFMNKPRDKKCIGVGGIACRSAKIVALVRIKEKQL
jgi:hypothetical protein